MASFLYNRGKLIMVDGTVTWGTTVVNCLLVTSSYTPNADHNFVSEVTANELSGGNYVRKTLANEAGPTEDDTNDRITYNADDITWTALQAAAGTPAYAIIYDDTAGTDATKELIAWITLTSPPTPNGGDYQVQWDAAGLFALNHS